MVTRSKWLFSLVALNLILSSLAFAQFENPDAETPQEIARAKALIQRDFANATQPAQILPVIQAAILKNYGYLDPNHEVPADLLKDAVLYYDANLASFPNKGYITIVDFKPRSDKYRLFIVNMTDGSVEQFHTTHGVGSDPNDTGTAKTFGNVINSGKSSLGFVRISELYVGEYKRSARLDGLSATNSNVRERAVVFHGWDGVTEANVIEGMSHGCITMDWKIKDGVLDKVGGGSLMYVGVAK